MEEDKILDRVLVPQVENLPGEMLDREDLDIIRQRKREVLAAFASLPLGKDPKRLCHLRVLRTWRTTDPEFNAKWREIQELRAHINLDPLFEKVPSIDKALVRKALEERDVQAIRLLYERMGLIQSGRQTNVKVATTLNASLGPERTPEELIEQLDKLGGIVLREVESIRSDEGDPPIEGPQDPAP